MANSRAGEVMIEAPVGIERRRALVLLGLGAALFAAVAVGLGVAQGLPFLGRGRTVEIPLMAKAMKFNGSNPSLEVQHGDTVRFLVRNDEAAGIPHDLVISGPGGVKSKPIAPGETHVVSFKPSQAGVYHYSCSLHPGLMDGRLIVRP